MTSLGSILSPKTRKDPPLYRGHFLLGVIPELSRDPLTLFLNAAREGGDVVRLRFGPYVSYQINHPDYIQHVLQLNNRNYKRRPQGNHLLKLISGLNLFTSDGEDWLSRRRLMQPIFHRRRIAAFAEIMTAASVKMLANWERAAAAGRALDVHQEMMRLTMEVVGKALFSVDLSADTSLLGNSFRVSMEYFNYRMSKLIYAPLFIPTRRNRELKRALAAVNRILQEMIDERRRTGEPDDDLMAMLLEARDEETGESMNDEQLRNELGIMIGAGHETTSNALTWTFALLAQHPAVEEKLVDELDTVLGGRIPTIADLPRLEYTGMVLDESMRLYPPAWSLAGREALQPDEIGGYTIPAGSGILILPYVMHRDPRFWEHPERFDPERFTAERVAQRPKFTYIPFGGGPRKCIGSTFALMEARLILATVLSRARLRLIPGYHPRPEPIFTLRVMGGLPMTVHFR